MVFWLVLAFLVVIFFVDFFFITNHEQVKNFWIPFFIFLSVLAVAASKDETMTVRLGLTLTAYGVTSLP